MVERGPTTVGAFCDGVGRAAPVLVAGNVDAPERMRSSRVRTTRVRSSSRRRPTAGAFARTPTSQKAKGFPHEQAIRSFKTALDLDRDADETHHQLSLVYSHVGLLDEARSHVDRAIDLNPNNTMARFRVGVYAAWQCRFEDALAVLKTVPSDVSPVLVDRVRAEVYVQLGRPDKARPIIDGYLARHPNDEGGSLTSVRALATRVSSGIRTSTAFADTHGSST